MQNRIQQVTCFKSLRQAAGFNSRAKAAEFCGVTPRTIKNWEKRGAPLTAIKLMGIFEGDLSHLGKEWRGVRLEPDCISTSKLDFVYPTEIRAMTHLYKAAGINRTNYVTETLGKEIRRLRS